VSSYGAGIPQIKGAKRIAGNIIWAGPEVEKVFRSKHRQDGVRYYENEKVYTRSLAILLCKGPVSGISRIWVNNEVFVDFRDPDGAYFRPPRASRPPPTWTPPRFTASTCGSITAPRTRAGSDLRGRRGRRPRPGLPGLVLHHAPGLSGRKFGALPNFEAEVVADGTAPSADTEFVFAPRPSQLRGTHEFTPEETVGVHRAGPGCRLRRRLGRISAYAYLFNKFSNHHHLDCPWPCP
jgi:hypothetical protein